MANSAGTMPNTGRWGWYKDHEGNEWRRATTLVKKVETDDFYLERWKDRQILLGAAVRDDIVLAVKAMGTQPPLGWTTEQKKKLAELAEQCMTAAGSDTGKILGTAVHDLTERVDRGEPIDQVCFGLPDQAAAGLRAYAKLRELNSWKSVEIERTVVCDELGVAGSFDRIDVVPGLAALLGPGTCQHGHPSHDPMGEELAVIVDVKTEGDPLKNGLHIGPQLAIYSRAKRMWLTEPDRYVPAPCVRQDVAIIVHVRDGKAVPYFVDLAAGWEAAQAAARQIEREKAAKKWFAPVPGIIEPKPAEVLTEVAVAGQYASPDRPISASMAEAIAPGASSTELARAMRDASHYTTTTLGTMPLPGSAPVQVAERGADGLVRWHEGMNEACSNCTSLVASATRVDGSYPDVPPSAITAITAFMKRHAEEIAAVRPDPAEVPAVYQVLDAIASAGTLAELGEIWQRWTDAGNAWEGPVAEAGEKRRRIIECPQAPLHQGAGRCACGWTGN